MSCSGRYIAKDQFCQTMTAYSISGEMNYIFTSLVQGVTTAQEDHSMFEHGEASAKLRPINASKCNVPLIGQCRSFNSETKAYRLE